MTGFSRRAIFALACETLILFELIGLLACGGERTGLSALEHWINYTESEPAARPGVWEAEPSLGRRPRPSRSANAGRCVASGGGMHNDRRAPVLAAAGLGYQPEADSTPVAGGRDQACSRRDSRSTPPDTALPPAFALPPSPWDTAPLLPSDGGARRLGHEPSVANRAGETRPTVNGGGILLANHYCAGQTLDQTCINNAIRDLGPWPAAAGTIFVPAGVYTLSGPVISHRNVNLIFDPAALLVDNGSADFSCATETDCIGMMRFCATLDCSEVPVTTGESGMFIFGPHFRIGQTTTVAFNGLGFGDSILERLWVDSTAKTYSTGIGTCAVFNGSTFTQTGDFRSTIIAPRCEFDAVGFRAGTLGRGSDWNSNTILGGFLEGNPALEIVRGTGNAVIGTQIAGTNSDGDTLISLGPYAVGNDLTVPFLDDGLGPGHSATAVVTAPGATDNTIREAHLDGEGGQLASGLSASQAPTVAWQPTFQDGNTTFGVEGNLYVPRSCGSTSRVSFGSQSAPTADCYGFSSPNLADGIETWNTHPIAANMRTVWDAFFQNSMNAKTQFGRISFSPVVATAGAESARVELDDIDQGALKIALECTGLACVAPGSVSIGGGAPIQSSDELARLGGANFGGAVSASVVTNRCSGITQPLEHGRLVVRDGCISGARPMSLVEAVAAGKQGHLSYTSGPGYIIIRSSSAQDRSTVSWAQN